MSFLKNCMVVVLVLQLGLDPILAQPVLNQQNPFQATVGSGITNLRITSQTADGTEALLTMDYTYDGFAGPTALIVPSIEKKNQKGVSVWFGSDPVTIGQGRGVISIKVKYFNDEPGVPPAFTSDRISVLMLNRQASAILTRIPFLKTIKWGNPNARPGPAAVAAPVVLTPARAVQLAEEKQLAENQARAEVQAREEARLKAEAEAATRRQAESKALAEAKSREEARLRAEAETARLVEEERLAEQKRIAAEKEREQARLKAEAKTKQLAEERRIAEERAAAQARAEEMARLETEAKAAAEARVREAARLQAEAKAKRIADELRTAEAQSVDEAKARETARLQAQAEADRLAKEKALANARAAEKARLQAQTEEGARIAAEQKALAEAKAREAARRQAEAEAARLDQEKLVAEQKAAAEAKAREQARLQAVSEVKRLAEESRVAGEKAKIEAAARRLAEQLARQEAEAQAKAEQQAARLAAEKAQAQQLASAGSLATSAAPLLEIAQGLKTKVTNVEIVQRSSDRSQMLIGVEYDYNKQDFGSKAIMGLDVLRLGEPQVAGYFHSPTMEIGKSRRNFTLFPVKFQPPGSIGRDASGFSTDKVLVYLMEAATGKRFNLFPAAILLMWHVPGVVAASTMARASGNSIEFDNFQQNDPSSGYVTVKYNLSDGNGKLHVRVFDDSNPKSADWFNTDTLDVKEGRGVQVLDVKVEPESVSPTAIFKANTIEIELVDASGRAVAKSAKKTSMTWAKPK